MTVYALAQLKIHDRERYGRRQERGAGGEERTLPEVILELTIAFGLDRERDGGEEGEQRERHHADGQRERREPWANIQRREIDGPRAAGSDRRRNA